MGTVSTSHRPSWKEKETLWDEVTRLFNPHKVYIDLSKKLYDVKKELLDQMSIQE